ncbi:hypothetical protein KIN20_006696 [Parelaphostrongylus tenuis]|uniref:Uncharacterized protein n=1 Tax=Parelaphostrongylus tenuis TaxID=148309 RepID=A0AAD5M454_PARTN|nr:hypothetical protein KIN20_006696 [Parelaphostrongylus tenuis]
MRENQLLHLHAFTVVKPFISGALLKERGQQKESWQNKRRTYNGQYATPEKLTGQKTKWKSNDRRKASYHLGQRSNNKHNAGVDAGCARSYDDDSQSVL